MSTLISQESGTDLISIGTVSSSDFRGAQSFTYITDMTMTGVAINVDSISGSPVAMTIRIETDNSGEPSGTLADANLTVAATPSASFYNFTFASSGELSASTLYWIVLSATGSDNNHFYQLKYDDAIYDDGSLAQKSGAAAWDTFSDAYDFQFKVFGIPDPEIDSWTKLAAMVTDGTYLLTASLDSGDADYSSAGGDDWTPIGTGSGAAAFVGSFDGNGFSISDLIANVSASYIGIFGYVNNATIENVQLIDVSITSSANVTGGLVGITVGSTTITNCYTTGSVSSDSVYLGGLIGAIGDGVTVTKCWSSCDVTGTGGGSQYRVGGLAGQSYGGTVADCYTIGAVSATGAYEVGGLIGVVQNSSTTSSCYTVGSVLGGYEVGGLIGNIDGAYVYDCYSTASAEEDAFGDVGGLVGIMENSATLETSYSTGTVTGSSSGGVVGNLADAGSYVKSCFSVSTVPSGGGGVIGENNTGDPATNILNCWWYSSEADGVGDDGTSERSGSFEKASGVSDFYNTSHDVYDAGAVTWDLTSTPPIWYAQGFTYPIPVTNPMVFYFNDHNSGTEWTTNPENMVDGDWSTYATTTGTQTQLLDENNVQASLGDIAKVELRLWGDRVGYGDNSRLYLRPVFLGGDGDNHTVGYSLGYPSDWFDITSDTNAPTWTWGALSELDCDVQCYDNNAYDPRVYKVEIQVTFSNRRVLIIT